MKIRLDSARYEPFRWQETVAIPASDLDLPGVEADGRETPTRRRHIPLMNEWRYR